MDIPKQYLPVMPYLILRDSGGFCDFMKNVFAAQEQLIVAAGDGGVMHGELRVGDAVIMFAGAGGMWKEKPAAMYLHVPAVDPLYKSALAHGAKSLEQPSRKEHGYTAGFEDPFGNHWFIVEA